MIQRSPLHKIHEKLGAKFTIFMGNEMPLYFTSIRDEHLTVRKAVGLFDVSHMCNVLVEGKDAERLMSIATVEDASRIPEFMSQYTVILREDGTIVDDTIFYHLPKGYLMVPNAGMGQKVANWFNEKAKEYGLDAKARDVSREYAILAIQGPRSREVLQKLTEVDLSSLKLFEFTFAKVGGVDCILSRTGYTGELGYELQITPSKNAIGLFEKILEEGKDYGIKPVGLGARDTLRLEKCFALACNEFEGGRTPLEAGLSFTINWDHDFIGKEALLKQKEEGNYERLTCLKCIERGVPRHGCRVEKDGKEVGKVSSGTLSPSLDVGIALAYMKPEYRKVGDIVDIVIREKKVKAEIVKPPFVKKG